MGMGHLSQGSAIAKPDLKHQTLWLFILEGEISFQKRTRILFNFILLNYLFLPGTVAYTFNPST